ncbi:MAG: ATP-binding protein [Bacteroidales bacterium]|nr:ATP-binding protein [Bacteroidales bacterium]
MRYLNKIVFINTAGKSIPYAEVNLDGNVHFIGTQGVGKSTLLRAVLFFYNADTRKLGIREGQKSYADFYYPFINSYIVYEVKTDTGFFCVLSFKYQNQVAFRFIASEYKKENYIADSKAFDSWDKIRDSFGKNIVYTPIISRYNEYRDIIYGNNKEIERKYRNYYILESKQYQKVPLTISNVFLNTKLDASVIKQTIISSLEESNDRIELARYTNHLKDFEKHLADIKKWTEKDQRGNSVVERLAQKISETYNRLIFIKTEKQQLASKLGFAYNRTQNEKPEIENLLNQSNAKKTELEKQINDLNSTFESQKTTLNQELGKISGKIEEANNRHKYYENNDIKNVIIRVENEDNISAQKQSLEKEKSILTDKFRDIESRFNDIVKQYENDFNQLKTKKEADKISAKETYLSDCERIKQQNAEIIDGINNQSKEQLSFFDTKINEKQSDITQTTIDYQVCQKTDLYKTELEKIKSELDELNRKISARGSELEIVKKEKESLVKNFEKEKDLKSKSFDFEIDKLKTEKDKLKIELDALNLKLDNFKGSFYDWLNNEIDGWENTIGQVVSDDVLFNKNLNPQFISVDNASLYGVEIELDEIGKNVKTIEDFYTEKQQIEDKLLKIIKQIQDTQKQKDVEIQKLQTVCNNDLKKLKDRQQKADYELTQSRPKFSTKGIDYKNLQEKAATDKAQQLAVFKTELLNLNNEKQGIENEKKAFEKQILEKITGQEEVCKSQLDERKSVYDKTIEKIDSEINAAKETLATKSAEANLMRENELKTKGADTEKIKALETQIKNCEKELSYIKDKRKLVSDYQKDKEELFDRMGEFSANLDQLKNDLDFETQKHKLEKAKNDNLLVAERQRFSQLQLKLNEIKFELEKFDDFSQSEEYAVLSAYILNCTPLDSTDQKCSKLIDEINLKSNSYSKEYEQMRSDVNKFMGNFDEKNLFSFKTKCSESEDYFQFAENLDEFIRENKFAEYKKRFQDRFANIVNVIGSEIQQLISKIGEIEGIKNAINKDFETRNFVGAINSLQLDIAPSENKIYQALVEIKKFQTENLSSFGLGNDDLFSQGIDTNLKNEKAVNLLIYLSKEIANSKAEYITLSDSFELKFRIVENNQDSGWVQKLSNVGSEGTDILIKAMINILLLNVFKERSIKKTKSEFMLHCMMDEIGKLHSTNIKGILNFANERNIILINSSPNPTNVLDYKYTYILRKNGSDKTSVTRLISK